MSNSGQRPHERQHNQLNPTNNSIINNNNTVRNTSESNSFVEINSGSDISSRDKSATSTPTRILAENYVFENNHKNENQLIHKTAIAATERPQSHISAATTKSVQDDDDDDNMDNMIEEVASRPKTSDISRSSSIHELINSRAGSPASSGDGDEQEQQVVTDYDIDEDPGLENIPRKNKYIETIVCDEMINQQEHQKQQGIEQEPIENSGESDVIDGQCELMDNENIMMEDYIEMDSELTEIGGNNHHAVNLNSGRYRNSNEKALSLADANEMEQQQEPERHINEYDSRSLTSTEESSDQISQNNNVNDKESSNNGLEFAKPIEKRKRPPMLLRKTNRVSDINKSMANNGTTISINKPNKSQDLFSSTAMRKYEKPREALNNCLNQLDSTNWETTMIGLQHFVRLIRFHPELIEANIHTACVALCKHVRNLRSQVSRSACQACGEFFATHSKHLEQEIEDLATTLLNRTADTNKFLRADATKALNAMCDYMPAHKTIQAIVARGATHPNAIVRTAAANLCNRIINRLGCDKIFSMGRESRDRLILAGANFMMEGSLETRNHAKMIFKQLSAHPQYSKTILEVIPSRTYRNIEKTLKTIK